MSAILQLPPNHLKIYETYFNQVNPSGTGTIGAAEAAIFLKKSSLPENSLHRIWEIADGDGKGYLDKQGFYVALKLISLAQAGKEVSIKYVNLPTPPPNLGGSPVGFPQLSKNSSPVSDTTSWAIKAKEKARYDAVFENLKPVNGYLTGEIVKPVLMNSKLPLDILGKIWEISDIDQDGLLDQDEFALAMHLVYRAIEGEVVPATLPAHLMPPSKRVGFTHISISSSTANKSGSDAEPISSVKTDPTSNLWVISPSMKSAYDQKFAILDTNKDGLVSGAEIKDILIASGLSQNILAHIWNLCDTKNSGLLNDEQFALAMYLIALKRSGKDLPTALSPSMIPPSQRPQVQTASINDLSSISIESSFNDFSAIKELDKISTDIDNLGREKVTLQQEISLTEEAIRKKKTEIEGLQASLEKANKGLEILHKEQKDAEKQLHNLDEEFQNLQKLLDDVNEQCANESLTLKQFKAQVDTQASTVKEQETELQKGRKELDTLRKNEIDLEQQIVSNKTELESLKKKNDKMKKEITDSESKVEKLTAENNSLKDQIVNFNSNAVAFESTSTRNGTGSLNELNANFETRFRLQDDQTSARATAGSSPVSSLSGFSVGSAGREEELDIFNKVKSDPFSAPETDPSDPFNSEDPFKNDPFKSVSFAQDPFLSDPFQTSDLFKSDDPFKSEVTPQPQEATDPFGSLDPFTSFSTTTVNTTTVDKNKAPSETEESKDPFVSLNGGAFSPKAFQSANENKPSTSDPFTSDPFANDCDPFSSTTTTNDPFSAVSPTSDPFSTNHTDPFSDSSKTDPFADSFPATVAKERPDDPWFAFGCSDVTKANDSADASEDTQLKWAKVASEKEEAARQSRLKDLAEREEMEIALALKQSVESSSEA